MELFWPKKSKNPPLANYKLPNKALEYFIQGGRGGGTGGTSCLEGFSDIIAWPNSLYIEKIMNYKSILFLKPHEKSEKKENKIPNYPT